MTESEDLKVGDLVSLRSGGPRMTVDNVQKSPNLVHCQWFELLGTGEWGPLREGYFLPGALKREG